MTKFSERLVQAARHAGVGESQSEIAQALGLKKQTVHHWFTKGVPEAENLALIAKRWGVNSEWLRSGEGPMLEQPNSDRLTTEELDLIKSYRLAPANVRGMIRSMARAARKSIVTIAAVLPPLLAHEDANASRFDINKIAGPSLSEYTLHAIRIMARVLGIARRRNKVLAPQPLAFA